MVAAFLFITAATFGAEVDTEALKLVARAPSYEFSLGTIENAGQDAIDKLILFGLQQKIKEKKASAYDLVEAGDLCSDKDEVTSRDYLARAIDLLKPLAANKKDLSARVTLAVALAKDTKLDEALTQIESAEKDAPSDQLVLCGKGYIQSMRATMIVLKAMGLDPNDPKAGSKPPDPDAAKKAFGEGGNLVGPAWTPIKALFDEGAAAVRKGLEGLPSDAKAYTLAMGEYVIRTIILGSRAEFVKPTPAETAAESSETAYVTGLEVLWADHLSDLRKESCFLGGANQLVLTRLAFLDLDLSDRAKSAEKLFKPIDMGFAKGVSGALDRNVAAMEKLVSSSDAPERSNLAFALACAEFGRGNQDKCMHWLDESTRIDGKSPAGLYKFDLMVLLNDDKGAASFAEDFLNRIESTEMRYGLVKAYEHLNRSDKMLSALSPLLKAQPKEPKYQLARIAAELRSADYKAFLTNDLDYLVKLSDSKEEDPDLLTSAALIGGVALGLHGDVDDAADVFKELKSAADPVVAGLAKDGLKALGK